MDNAALEARVGIPTAFRPRPSFVAFFAAIGLSIGGTGACSETNPRPDGGIEGPPPVVEIPSDLPLWKGVEVAAIGTANAEGHDFILPDPLGVDTTGVIYVIDPELQEVRAFDSAGVYLRTVVKRGEGPGEMRLRPLDYGFLNGKIWFGETATGRINYVNTDGRAALNQETHLTATRLKTGWVRLAPLRDGTVWLEMWSIDRADPSIRPALTLNTALVSATNIRQVGAATAPGHLLVLDKGLTQLRYPGTNGATVFLPYGRGRAVRIDRPLTGGLRAEIRIVMDSAGIPVRRRTLTIAKAYLTHDDRDSLREAIERRATLGGRRPVGPNEGRLIGELVSALPDELPAFTHAAVDPQGEIWLRLNQRMGGSALWLVVDSAFSPVARASLPASATRLIFAPGKTVLTQVVAEDDVRYVARMRIGGQ